VVGAEEKWVGALYDRTFARNCGSGGVLRDGMKGYAVLYQGQLAHNGDLSDQNRANRELSAMSGNIAISSLISLS
jgi:hypothetical protein